MVEVAVERDVAIAFVEVEIFGAALSGGVFVVGDCRGGDDDAGSVGVIEVVVAVDLADFSRGLVSRGAVVVDVVVLLKLGGSALGVFGEALGAELHRVGLFLLLPGDFEFYFLGFVFERDEVSSGPPFLHRG